MKSIILALALATGLTSSGCSAYAMPATTVFPGLAASVGGPGSVIIPGLAVSIIGMAILSGITSPKPPSNPGYKGNPYLPGPHCKITPAQRKCA